MTYAEKQLERFNRRTARFLELLDTDRGGRVLAEEGGLIIASVIALAGPETMACYAGNALANAMQLDGICPWDHDDDPALHPIVAHGMCAEHVKEREDDMK